MPTELKPHGKFKGIFLVDGKIATKNLVPGRQVYGERLVKEGKKEYRLWDPNRSKLAAAIVKGISNVPIDVGMTILYLGAAHGTTVSHISDIISKSGLIYAVEISERCFNELVPVCKERSNIVPILADARFPEKYGIFDTVDLVYCDIADRHQTEIATDNCKKFLKPNGFLMLAIKTRSIDVSESPKKVVNNEIRKLKQLGFDVLDWKMLDPFEKDHGFVVAKMTFPLP